MPLIQVRPERYRKIRFDTPKSRRVKVIVEATASVDVFVVPADEIDQWRGGKDYNGGGFFRQKNIEFEVSIKNPGDWFLVLENRSDTEITAHYEVYPA